MSGDHGQATAAATALLAAMAFAPNTAQAEYKCAKPNGRSSSARAEALRHFIERTRGMRPNSDRFVRAYGSLHDVYV
jgi:hypothetical protein